MKAPRKFLEPLAIGAPRPFRELPSRLERMIHFVPPHIEKMRAKAGELAAQVDVVLGNLEDAIPIEAKAAAREGFIAMARAVDFGATGLWVRVNALNSPWFLDDMTRLIGEIGDKLDVVMLPKVEGPWDIHFIDQYLALLEARHAVKQAHSRACDPRNGRGRQQRRRHRGGVPAHARHEPRTGGPRRLARDEDDAGRRRPPRLSRPCRPERAWRAPIERAAGSLALYDRAHGRRVRGQRHQAVLWPVRRLFRPRGLRNAVPQRLPDGLRRRLDPASQPDRDRQGGVFARPRGGRVRAENPRRDARRIWAR